MRSDVEVALWQLDDANPYRDNMFRITELPVGATAAQIRRRRDEARLMARMAPSRAGAAGPDRPTGGEEPDSGPDAAFAAMRDPVVRIVHEILWLWCDAAPGTCSRDDHAFDHRHDDAVRAHRYAVEGPPTDQATYWRRWEHALALWSEICSSDALEGRLRRRADEIDDPRLGPDEVAELRRSLPARLLGINAALAAQAAASNGHPAHARLHVQVVRGSTFGAVAGEQALRRAVSGRERRVRDDCAAAERDIGADTSRALHRADELLDGVGADLQVVRTLLGAGNGVPMALEGLVADTVNAACVRYIDGDGDGDGEDVGAVLSRLRRVRAWAHEPSSAENIDSNIGVAERRLVRGRAEPLCRERKVDRAADALRGWRRRTRDPETRRLITDVLEDPRLLAGPLAGAPQRGMVFIVIGAHFYGRRAPTSEDHVQTQYLTLLGIPLLPLASFLVDQRYVYCRVPLSRSARWWRGLTPLVLFLLVLLGSSGEGVGWQIVLIGLLALLLSQIVGLIRVRVTVSGWLRSERGVVDTI